MAADSICGAATFSPFSMVEGVVEDIRRWANTMAPVRKAGLCVAVIAARTKIARGERLSFKLSN